MNPLVSLQIMIPVETLHTLITLERSLAQGRSTTTDHSSSIVRHDLAIGTDDEHSRSVAVRSRRAVRARLVLLSLLMLLLVRLMLSAGVGIPTRCRRTHERGAGHGPWRLIVMRIGVRRVDAVLLRLMQVRIARQRMGRVSRS
jgi:hypothetical protein